MTKCPDASVVALRVADTETARTRTSASGAPPASRTSPVIFPVTPATAGTVWPSTAAARHAPRRTCPKVLWKRETTDGMIPTYTGEHYRPINRMLRTLVVAAVTVTALGLSLPNLLESTNPLSLGGFDFYTSANVVDYAGPRAAA